MDALVWAVNGGCIYVGRVVGERVWVGVNRWSNAMSECMWERGWLYIDGDEGSSEAASPFSMRGCICVGDWVGGWDAFVCGGD